MKKLTPERLDRLGQLVDKCDNYLAYKGNRLFGHDLKIGAYESGLTELRKEILALYVELGGDAGNWPE